MSIGGCVCGSTNCKRYEMCKRAICEEENKQYYVTNWYSYGSGRYTDDGKIEEEWYCGERGNYAMFEPLDEPSKNGNEVVDDRVYMKTDELDIYYNSGVSENGIIYDRPYLMVARYNKQDMTVENRFYDDEAVELYKKLTEYRR